LEWDSMSSCMIRKIYTTTGKVYAVYLRLK
jgi:hypothetical protein